MSSNEEFRRALERKRALLRARDVEIGRAKELRSTAATLVMHSREVVRCAQELLDKLYELRRQRERISAQDALPSKVIRSDYIERGDVGVARPCRPLVGVDVLKRQLQGDG